MNMKFLGTAETVEDADRMFAAELGLQSYIVLWFCGHSGQTLVQADSPENAKQGVIAFFEQFGMHITVLSTCVETP